MLHARLAEIEDRITAIDEQISDLQNERFGLVYEQETLRKEYSVDVETAKTQMTVLMKSVGMNDEAIEVALAAQFGGNVHLLVCGEDKPRRGRISVTEVIGSVRKVLTREPQSSKQIQEATGYDKQQVGRALKSMIVDGLVESAGATNAAKYWLKGEAQ